MLKYSIFIMIFLSGCAIQPGSYYTSAGEAAVKHGTSVATEVYSTGSQPKDKRVNSIIKDFSVAKKSLISSRQAIDSKNAEIAVLERRLHFFYWIFGIPIAIIGGLIIWQLLKFFAFI